MKPFKKAALVAKRQCVVVNQVLPEVKSGLDAMILFRRGETFDKLQMISLIIFNSLDEETSHKLFMELKDILTQEPPLLCKPRGATCVHYGGHGFGKAVGCRSKFFFAPSINNIVSNHFYEPPTLLLCPNTSCQEFELKLPAHFWETISKFNRLKN